MKEIHIYHSLKQYVLLVAGSVAFVIIGIFMLVEGKYSFIAWIGIVFFGFIAIVYSYWILKERITQQPYLCITETSIIMTNRKSIEYHFADIDTFFLTEIRGVKTVGINYKTDIEQNTLNNSVIFEPQDRKSNNKIAGNQDFIPVDKLTISPEILFNLLNKRLTSFKDSSAIM